MKRYLNSTVISCLCGMMMWVGAAFNAYAQYEYRIGKGESSIEPGKHVLSLALAGYGAPRDGRFSLEWVPYLHQEHGADAAAIVAAMRFTASLCEPISASRSL